jgi:putative tricarboxylic transport membrane protein
MKKILIISLVILFVMAPGAWAGKTFPKRNITAAVVWGAGGGTDTCVRIITAEMQPFLGVNINVINKTGGVSGSVGMNHA